MVLKNDVIVKRYCYEIIERNGLQEAPPQVHSVGLCGAIESIHYREDDSTFNTVSEMDISVGFTINSVISVYSINFLDFSKATI